MNDIFENRIKNNGKTRVPVWFMRQAGRYHQHYQNLKKSHDFMELCKTPSLACEVTMGPIEDFKFDAAILFSDLLFPLEELGTGLIYDPGPKLDLKLSKLDDLKRLKQNNFDANYYEFQAKACELLKKTLPEEKTLLGFVGAPFTLYAYAVEGSHAGSLVSSKTGLYDGRYEGFLEVLLPNLYKEMITQANAGADAMCLFDTAVGELTPKDYKKFIVPHLRGLTKKFKAEFPDKKIIYYSRNTHFNHLDLLEDDNIDVIGVDWRHDFAEAINRYSKDYYVQGNIDPCWLHLEWKHLENHLQEFWNHLEKNKVDFSKWICGLGHGVFQHTPEENVRNTVQFIHDNFRY